MDRRIRGLLSIADFVETKEKNLSLYLDQAEERLLRVSKSERILLEYKGPVSTSKKQKKEERPKQWKGKQFHGKFVRETEVRSEKAWRWVRKDYLKKETEGSIFAVQQQALRTNWISKSIDDREILEKYKICGERDESITHLIAECKKLTKKKYKDIILQGLYIWNYARSLA